MGVIAKEILRGCQGLFTPVSLGYPLSVFNEKTLLSSALRKRQFLGSICVCNLGPSAYAYVFKSKFHCLSAVQFGRALPGFPITARHLYAFLLQLDC